MKSAFKKVAMVLTTASVLGVAGLTATTHHTVQAATAGQVASVVSDSAATVYAQPNTSAKAVSSLAKGSCWKVVSVKQSNGETWYEVGGNQWVQASNLADGDSAAQAPSSVNSQAQAVINVAKAQIGKPYVWGAKGPSSFDCSGLIYYAFQQALGRNVGGWTVAQESAGRSVSLNEAQPGDLLFWGAPGASYHVALFLGNHQYVNAPQPGQNVQIQTVSPYFYPSFAVRPF